MARHFFLKISKCVIVPIGWACHLVVTLEWSIVSAGRVMFLRAAVSAVGPCHQLLELTCAWMLAFVILVYPGLRGS